MNPVIAQLLKCCNCSSVAFDKFKAWETGPNVCFPDLPEKLPHLEVYEQALTDKSKQQLSLH